MSIVYSLIRTVVYFILSIFIQANFKIDSKKYFIAFFLMLFAFNIFFSKYPYFNYLILIFLSYFLQRVAMKNNNFISLRNITILITIIFTSRILSSAYFLLYHNENYFNDFNTGFSSLKLILITFLISIPIIWIYRHLSYRIKKLYKSNNSYYAKLFFVDFVLMIPCFFLLNILIRYIIKHINLIHKIEYLNIIFYSFLIMMLIGNVIVVYLINIFLLSKHKFNILLSQAEYDSLTDVYNRKFGMENLHNNYLQNKLSDKNLVICFLDVNNLKTVNDRFGHPEGDDLIKTVANITKSSLRNNDYMFRYGGDEFIVVFQNCSVDDAKNAWRRIKEKYDFFNIKSEKKFRISVSAGFVSSDEHPDLDIEDLIDIADNRMYRNKKIYKSSISEFQNS